MSEKIITITAAAEVSGKKIPKISGVAYAGGVIDIAGGIVVDLSGMDIPANIPLLADHSNSIEGKIGELKVTNDGSKLVVSGTITSPSWIASNVIEQAKNGAKWHMSIGARLPDGLDELVEDETINGQIVKAGMPVARKSILREVSVVAVGADADTSVTIAAKATIVSEPVENKVVSVEPKTIEGTQKMNEKQTTEVDITAALAENALASKRIKAVCDGDTKTEDKAIEAGWTAEQTAAEVLKNIRASRPSVTVSVKSEANVEKTLEAALLIRAGVDEKDIIKSVGEQAIEAGYKCRNASIKDVATECIKASGGSVGLGFGNSEIKAAFTTSLPGILGNVANKRLQQAFKAYSPVALKLAQVADINDFKTSEIYSIADFSNLSEVTTVGDNVGKLTADKIVEAKGTNQLKTMGKIISLTRQQIINDDLGAFLRIADILGNRCAKTIDQSFFAKLLSNPTMADQAALFSTAHKNLLDITLYGLAVDKVRLAIAEFLKQTGLDGEPIGAMPKYLVVPPELYFLAKEICESTYMIGGSGKTTAMNPVAGLLQVVQSPYLSNATYSGYSATDWYLFSDPQEVPALEIGFLKGMTTPTIEGSDADFDTLGYSWRCYYDIGVGVGDYRGVLKAGTVPTESSSGE